MRRLEVAILYELRPVNRKTGDRGVLPEHIVGAIRDMLAEKFGSAIEDVWIKDEKEVS